MLQSRSLACQLHPKYATSRLQTRNLTACVPHAKRFSITACQESRESNSLSKIAKQSCNLALRGGGGARLHASLVNLGLGGKLVGEQVGQDDQDCKITKIAGNLAFRTKFHQDCTMTKIAQTVHNILAVNSGTL